MGGALDQLTSLSRLQRLSIEGVRGLDYRCPYPCNWVDGRAMCVLPALSRPHTLSLKEPYPPGVWRGDEGAAAGAAAIATMRP